MIPVCQDFVGRYNEDLTGSQLRQEASLDRSVNSTDINVDC